MKGSSRAPRYDNSRHYLAPPSTLAPVESLVLAIAAGYDAEPEVHRMDSASAVSLLDLVA